MNWGGGGLIESGGGGLIEGGGRNKNLHLKRGDY